MKTKLLELFTECCKKRPHDLTYDRSNNHNIYDKLSTKSDKFCEEMNSKIIDMVTQYEKFFTNIRNYKEKPLNFSTTCNCDSSPKGFLFLEGPPIFIAFKTTYIHITLNPFKFDKVNPFHDKQYYDYATFNFVFRGICNKTFTDINRVFLQDEKKIEISYKQIFLIFGDLYAQITNEEYKNMKDLLEETKIEFSKQQLTKRIEELKNI